MKEAEKRLAKLEAKEREMDTYTNVNSLSAMDVLRRALVLEERQ